MKRFLITGASRGIGRAIALKLAAPDVVLLLHGRDTGALAETCRAADKPTTLLGEPRDTQAPIPCLGDLPHAHCDPHRYRRGHGTRRLLVAPSGHHDQQRHRGRARVVPLPDEHAVPPT